MFTGPMRTGNGLDADRRAESATVCRGRDHQGTRRQGEVRTIFLTDERPYAVVWHHGSVMYLHDWSGDQLGRLLDARLLADYLRARAVHGAAFEWLLTVQPGQYAAPDGHGNDGDFGHDDDEYGVGRDSGLVRPG